MFLLYSDSLGLPLEIIIEHLWENGCVIDWLDFYTDARKSGMKHENVSRLIRGGFIDQNEEAKSKMGEFLERMGEIGGIPSEDDRQA